MCLLPRPWRLPRPAVVHSNLVGLMRPGGLTLLANRFGPAGTTEGRPSGHQTGLGGALRGPPGQSSVQTAGQPGEWPRWALRERVLGGRFGEAVRARREVL